MNEDMNYVHFVAKLILIMPKINCLAPVASLKCILTLTSLNIYSDHMTTFLFILYCVLLKPLFEDNMFSCGLALRTLDFYFNSSELFSQFQKLMLPNPLLLTPSIATTQKLQKPQSTHHIKYLRFYHLSSLQLFHMSLETALRYYCTTQPLESTLVNSILVVSERNAKKSR